MERKQKFIFVGDGSTIIIPISNDTTVESLVAKIIKKYPKYKDYILHFGARGIIIPNMLKVSDVIPESQPIFVSALFPIKIENDKKIFTVTVNDDQKIENLVPYVREREKIDSSLNIKFKFGEKELPMKDKIVTLLPALATITMITEKSIVPEPPASPTNLVSNKEIDAFFSTMAEMGFAEKQAKVAYIFSGNSPQSAANYIVSGKADKILKKIQNVNNPSKLRNKELEVLLNVYPERIFHIFVNLFTELRSLNVILEAPKFFEKNFRLIPKVDWEMFYLRFCHEGILKDGNCGSLIDSSHFSDTDWAFDFLIKARKADFSNDIFESPRNFFSQYLPQVQVDFESITKRAIEEGIINEDSHREDNDFEFAFDLLRILGDDYSSDGYSGDDVDDDDNALVDSQELSTILSIFIEIFLDTNRESLFTEPNETLDVYGFDYSFAHSIIKAEEIFSITSISKDHLREIWSRVSGENTVIKIIAEYRQNDNNIEHIKQMFKSIQ